MSMARSTPAQNDRGAASSTRRGPTRSAQSRSAGPILCSVSSARAPAVAVFRLVIGRYAVSTMTRTTAVGTPGAARTIAADSISTAIAPVAARRARAACPRTMRSVLTIGPVRTRSPMRRNSATRGAAARCTMRPRPSRTSVATTTSPGRSVGSRPPATPATTSAPGASSASCGSHPRTFSGPMPHRVTVAPGTRRTSAAYSARSAVTTRSLVTATG